MSLLRHQIPLAHSLITAAKGMLICFSAIALFQVLQPKQQVADQYFDQQLLDGLLWLHQQTESPVPALMNADAACNVQINTKLKQLSQRLQIKTLALQLPDCQPTEAVGKALNWLARISTDKAKSLLTATPMALQQQIANHNPFLLPGCVFIETDQANAVPGCPDTAGMQAISAKDLKKDALWSVLANYAKPGDSNHYDYVSNGVAGQLQQGAQVYLTLKQQTQTAAQNAASCFTGDLNACHRCPWCNVAATNTFYEQARARMLSVVVVDVASGNIEALASSESACYQALHSGQALSADCPKLPTDSAVRPYKLGNHAFMEVMPASLVKIPLTAALLEQDLPLATRNQLLNDWLVRSDTEAYIDTVLCKDQAFAIGCVERRFKSLQKQIDAFQFNSPNHDLLDGVMNNGLDFAIPSMRWLSNTKQPAFDVDAITRCYQHGAEQRWSGCQGEALVNYLAELYGQGNAMSTPLTIAQMLLKLAHAEQGHSLLPPVHLRQQLAPSLPVALSQNSAIAIVQAMQQTHVRGSAKAACDAAKTVNPGLMCIAQTNAKWRIAGKTGTQSFSADALPLTQWRNECQSLKQLPQLNPQQRHQLTKCGFAPYKWYAALAGPANQPFSKIVVVLAERNWRLDGSIDSRFDKGSNVAAELGLSLIASQWQKD